MVRFNTDSQADVDFLISRKESSYLEVKPRDYNERRYGSTTLDLQSGIVPIEARPDVLVQPDQYKEVIAHCHEQQIFPMYHQQATWAPEGFKSYQNGIGYCWTWSGTATLLDVRALEGLETVLLVPVSMGYLVGWKDRGNYLESFIQGARNDGIVPIIGDQKEGFNSLNRSSSYWNKFDSLRGDYRLDEVWDTDPSSTARMIQHCLSILAYGRPLYIAYNWWGHALELVGLLWDESQPNNLVWVIRNSHGETTFIELTGSRGIPSEAYGFISTAA